MSLIVETKEVKKQITLMTNPRAGFVSLVKHAASRQPFRVIKTEKGGNITVKSMVVQSILLPNGMTIGDLAHKSGKAWLSEASAEKAEKYDSFTKFTQVSVEKFEHESLKLVKVEESGAFALVGQLLPDTQVKGAITLGEDDVAKAAELPVAPMDAIFGNTDTKALIVQNFAALFDRETYSVLDIVHGLLRQTATDPKKRKVAILTALDGYKNFISLGLDALNDSAVKFEGGPTKFYTPAETKTQTTNKGEVEMELFKTQEEFTTAVKSILDVHDDQVRTKVNQETTVAEAKKRDENFDTLTKTVQSMATTVNTLVKKTEKLEIEPDTDAASSDGGTVDTEGKAAKTEDKDAAGGIDMSVFSGLLTATKKD